MPVFAVCLAASAPGCSRGIATDAEAKLVERSHVSMGSALRISAWAPDDARTSAALEEVFQQFDRLDALLSVWREGSDVQRVNAAAGREAVPVSRELLEVLAAARQVSEWTGGKFDATFAALSDVWRFDHDRDGRVPSAAELAVRLPLVDYKAVSVDERAGTVFLETKGMRLHVGGVGKGYAIDRAAAILRARGIHDFIIQSGGDLYASGRRANRPWRVGIQDPRGADNVSFAAMALTDAALSTSGDYERAFLRDGRRYHHILDPASGMPADRSRSVSILARSATLADALSTGVFVMGPDEGLALVERLPDVEAVIVGSDNAVVMSSGLRGRLALLARPTDAP